MSQRAGKHYERTVSIQLCYYVRKTKQSFCTRVQHCTSEKNMCQRFVAAENRSIAQGYLCLQVARIAARPYVSQVVRRQARGVAKLLRNLIKLIECGQGHGRVRPQRLARVVTHPSLAAGDVGPSSKVPNTDPSGGGIARKEDGRPDEEARARPWKTQRLPHERGSKIMMAASPEQQRYCCDSIQGATLR